MSKNRHPQKALFYLFPLRKLAPLSLSKEVKPFPDRKIRVATVREIRTFFKVRVKVKKSAVRESLDIVKVSEKSGNFVFRFIVQKLSSRF